MKNIKKSHIFMTLLFLSIMFVGGFVISKIRILFPQIVEKENLWLLQGISSLSTFFIPIIFYFAIFNKKFKEVIPLKRLSIKNLFAIIFLAIAIQPFIAVVSSFTDLFFKDEIVDFIDYFANLNIFKTILIIAVIPAITEELAIRGIVLYGYKNKVSIYGILISALYFGMMHFTFTQLFYTMTVGIVFAYVVKVTGSIYSSILMHFMLNGMQITLASLLAKYGDTAYNTNDLGNTFDISKILMDIFGNEKVVALVYSVYIFIIYLPLLLVSILIFYEINKENIKKLKENDLAIKNNSDNDKEKLLGLVFWLNFIIYIAFMLLSRIGENYGL